jgi:hypothetical protein
VALEPDINDYVVVDPASTGDTRGTRPYLAVKIGERRARQATFDGTTEAAMFDSALKRAQAALAWEDGPKPAASAKDG